MNDVATPIISAVAGDVIVLSSLHVYILPRTIPFAFHLSRCFSTATNIPLEFSATIVSRVQLNTAADFPVFRYKLQLRSTSDLTAFAAAAHVATGDLGSGCPVYITLPVSQQPSLRRPYVQSPYIYIYIYVYICLCVEPPWLSGKVVKMRK
jgi:hypothetical protein